MKRILIGLFALASCLPTVSLGNSLSSIVSQIYIITPENRPIHLSQFSVSYGLQLDCTNQTGFIYYNQTINPDDLATDYSSYNSAFERLFSDYSPSDTISMGARTFCIKLMAKQGHLHTAELHIPIEIDEDQVPHPIDPNQLTLDLSHFSLDDHSTISDDSSWPKG